MVRCVCTSDDVKHNRMSRQLDPSSRMTTKSKWSFGLWRSLDFVFALLLLLQCFSAATTTTTTITSAAGATTSAADRTTHTTNTSAATAVTAATVTTTETKGTATTAARTTTTETDTTAKNTRSATITTAQNAATTQNAMSAATTAENVTTTQNAMSATTTAENVTTTQNAATTATPAIATITPEMTTALPTTPMPCSFELSCNQTFYWMAISVHGLFPNANQNQVVEAWFKPVFQNNLSECVDATVSKSSSRSTSALTMTPDPFLDMRVSCEPQPVATEALCEVLLKLSRPVDVCCIKNTVIEAGNVTINGTFIGGVERVGVCLDNTTNNTSGPYNECNNSSNSDHQCSGNWTCGNNTDNIQKNCTIIPPTSSENSCNCSSTCNSSDAYYRLTVDNMTMNISTLESFIGQWLKNSSYQLNYLECSGTMYTLQQNCTVIVRQNKGRVFDVCPVIKYHNVSLAVNRVAMCSWSSDNPYKRNITWIQHPVSFEDFCRNNSLNSLVNCSSGSSVGVLLNDSCNSNINGTSPTPSSTTPPSSIDAGELLNMTANASSLNSTQVDSIITMLERLLSGPNVSVALANTSVGIVNNLLDVPVAVMAPFSKRANGIVDTLGLKLVVSGESETLLTSSLALAVKKVNGTKFQEISFFITNPSNVEIRSGSRLKRDVRSVPLGSAILPASLTQNLSSQQQQLASRVQFNFYQKSTFFQDEELVNRSLISGILSASVANLTISNLQKKVTITLQHTETPGNRTVSCAFWNLSLNGDRGGWSSEGCTKVNSSSSQEETQCSCNHLTSFGILLDLSKQPIDPLQNTILTYITHIGCGISSIFLSITLLTYLAFSKLRNDIPSKILIQLCLALLMLNLVFLVDGWLAQFSEVKGLCTSTAFFLHYFLLASFTWMAMEAVHMYIALVKVFNTYISRFMLKIGFAGWGIPLVVVIIVIATDHIPTRHNYGLVSYSKFVDGTQDDFCWITNDIVFYVAVVAYFCIVFLINFTMFIVVLIQLCRIKRQNPQNVQNRSSWQEIRSVAGLTVLLGLTWGFAFFAWGPVNLPFMYLFAIFNSLQGLFIFIYHCALKENVRRQWRTYLCCGKMRLPENSEWSLTATQKNKKVSKKRPSSAHSNNSRLSFLNNDSTASDLPMGISNPYDDRIITASEEPSSDVVLNEINNKHRGKKSY
ncbi:adhesion G-protein coupled receptor G2 [Triplophysa rosa]|uniref:Adhesion G-protein coupled receptor G2 n=1 Tax=Triplophysa rosa TaxID=992332 RepID=A0A9W7WB83_TRIRA|nr:adhesion G-protein coupled receptor G2 [Triplophysa rosa]KAI7793726.1 putative G-protein coupled receptor 64-like [Triplophysa rosa]